MLYVGVDSHLKQLLGCVLSEGGQVAGQVAHRVRSAVHDLRSLARGRGRGRGLTRLPDCLAVRDEAGCSYGYSHRLPPNAWRIATPRV